MNGYYVIPHRCAAMDRIAYCNPLVYLAKLPLYYVAHEWGLSTWWKKIPAA
jgi:hypothetical protein